MPGTGAGLDPGQQRIGRWQWRGAGAEQGQAAEGKKTLHGECSVGPMAEKTAYADLALEAALAMG